MKSTAELIEQLAALETRVSLTLRDGTWHEGYVLDTGPEHFELALGGPLAPDEPIVIAYENVEPRSLSYLDCTERRYQDLVSANACSALPECVHVHAPPSHERHRMTAPETIAESEVYRGWLRIVRRRLRHPTGGVQEYEIINPDSHSVCAVVLDRSTDVVLVELYRFGQERRLMELPAGAVDPGESFEEAIRREVLEETGYEGELTPVGSHFVAAEHGVTRHVFVARNCTQVRSPSPEPSEIDEGAVVRVVPMERFRAHVRSGELTETAGAFMALDWLGAL